jgi:hypothetical protein
MASDVMQKMKQGFEVSFTRELHVGTELADGTEFLKSSV